MVKNKLKEKLNQTAKFVRNNWKGLLALGGLVVVGAILSSKDSGYDDGDDSSIDSNYDNSMKFTKKWFKNATDDELESEREKVRLRYIDGSNIDIDEASRLYDVLHTFDGEMIDRANTKYENEHPDAQPRHREHGWYLPNDD